MNQLTSKYFSRPGIKADAVTVGPDFARQVLEKSMGAPLVESILTGMNTKTHKSVPRIAGNRSIRPRKIYEYAEAMSRGKWPLNGETLKFDTQGELLDGQHRLLAVLKSEAEVPFLVVTGLPPTVMSTLDTGCNRTTADVITINGIQEHPRALGAAAKLLLIIDEISNGRAKNPTTCEGYIQNQYVWDFVSKHTEPLVEAVIKGNEASKTIGLNSSGAAAAVFATFKANPEKAQEFVDGLLSGTGYEKGDPRLALQRWALNNKGNSVNARVNAFAAYIKAWNFFLAKSSVHILRLASKELPAVEQ